MSDLDDIGVIIPYSRLCELLCASSELKGLRRDIKRVYDQQASLKGQIMEIMEILRDLR